jgi:hypothetical protein
MTIQPITYRGRTMAAATRSRFFLADALDQRPAGDPELTFVIFMCAYAGDVLSGILARHFCPLTRPSGLPEPDALKGASPVLRRAGRSNASALSDHSEHLADASPDARSSARSSSERLSRLSPASSRARARCK